MKIKLDENYIISQYQFGYILKRRYIGKKGKSKGMQIEKELGYFPTIKLAIESYLLVKGADEDETVTMEEYISRYEKATERLIDMLNERVAGLFGRDR